MGKPSIGRVFHWSMCDNIIKRRLFIKKKNNYYIIAV